MDHPHAQQRRGVLLVNVGTPDAPDVGAVRKYLTEFLSDPLVIQLPRPMRWMQGLLARFIAWRRAPRSAKKYQQIWTDRGSPLRTIMEDQAEALSHKLRGDWSVFLGMRYGSPSIAQALASISKQNIEELVVIPLYPHFSQTTTGTVVDEVYRVLQEHGLHLSVSARTTWHNDASYLNAQAHLIAEHARANSLDPSNSMLLFSAHSLPVSYIRRGDPYERQLNETIRLLTDRLGWPTARYQNVFQSKMGPGQWLGPDLPEALRELAGRGELRVLLCPVSFAVDCLETLEEIHIRAREEFQTLGGELHVCPALNTAPRFIDTLRNLTTRGPQQIMAWSRGQKPLFGAPQPKESTDPSLDRLVMVGATLKNRIGAGRGPQLAYSEPDGLACAKKPHEEVQALLETLKGDGQISEAFIWNTCFRFECYAWLKGDNSTTARQCAVDRLRQKLFDTTVPGLRINTLFGTNAWHHLMRTIAGLNSGLPGDKDIIEQFSNAFQLAERAETTGEHARALVKEAIELAESVRSNTVWGRLDPGYCLAAITRVSEVLPLRPANARHVVIGGSTTSRSILQSLYTQFNVKESAVTLVYRNHQGGQMKLLRKAVGHGRRLRTQSYTDPTVIEAIADADVVYYGIDRDDPVLSADALRGLRDFNERPLFVLDFNTAGSTRDLHQVSGVRLWDAKQLDLEVEAFAEAMCSDESFPQILQEAERWIENRSPGPIGPSLDLPCGSHNANGHSSCTRCGTAPDFLATRSCSE